MDEAYDGLAKWLPKYSENCVFATRRPAFPRNIELYFRGLHRKFVTWRNNRIFSRINELPMP
jgi:hypothetical protein